MSLRISGGSLRGLKISVPKVQKVRPTSERVREAIFSKINHELKEATFLDICSGSGVMSIEAISRGSSFACIVEKHRRCIPVIRENLRKCKIGNHQYKIIVGDGKKISAEMSDIVFLDPPYEKFKIINILETLYKLNLVKEKALGVLEVPKSSQIKELNEYSVLKERKVSNSLFYFIIKN